MMRKLDKLGVEGARAAVALTLALLAPIPSGVARAQPTAAIESLDHDALEAYHNLDVDDARQRLDRAIAQAASAPAPLRARLLVHRGVVSLGGQQNRDAAINDFIAAIQLDPAVRIEPELSTPEIASAFDLARQRAARGATTRPVTTPPATTPTTPPTTATTRPATTPPATTPATTPVVTTTAVDPATTAATVDPAATPSAEAGAGLHVVGDACAASSECESGLVCETGICTTPSDGFVEPETPARFFFQLGYGIGGGYARDNMRADTTIPFDPENKPAEWNDAVNGPYAPPGYTEGQWANVIQARYASYVAPGVGPGTGPVTHSTDCSADAGEYCVRVKSPGFVPTGGYRFVFGYWLTSRMGLSMEWRIQTHAGVGTFGRLLASARAHVRLTPQRNEGFTADVFGGLGFGQIQLRPRQGHYRGPSLCTSGSVGSGQACDDASVNPTPGFTYLQEGVGIRRPWIQTGPLAIELGGTVGYHFTRSFGVLARPTVFFMVPSFTFVAELTLGAEIAF